MRTAKSWENEKYVGILASRRGIGPKVVRARSAARAPPLKRYEHARDHPNATANRPADAAGRQRGRASYTPWQ